MLYNHFFNDEKQELLKDLSKVDNYDLIEMLDEIAQTIADEGGDEWACKNDKVHRTFRKLKNEIASRLQAGGLIYVAKQDYEADGMKFSKGMKVKLMRNLTECVEVKLCEKDMPIEISTEDFEKVFESEN